MPQENMSCKSCNYQGDIQLKHRTNRHFYSFFYTTCITVFAGLLGYYGIYISCAIFGFFYVLYLNLTAIYEYECPACKAVSIKKTNIFS